MRTNLQKNSVNTHGLQSISKLIFGAMLVLTFSFAAQNANAQKNVVAGLLPTISVDSLTKTNCSRIYITDGVEYDTLPEHISNLVPERFISVLCDGLFPVTVDFTFPSATLTAVDVYSGWYEGAGKVGNGGEFSDLSIQTFNGSGWVDIAADTTRSYEGLAIHFRFTTAITTDKIRLNIKGLAADASDRIRINEIKVWDNSVNALVSTKANATLSTYPNPVKDMLYVNLDNQSNANVIEVLNLTGKVLLSQQVNGSKLVSIDTKELPAGVYVCRTTSASGIYTAKIVKQ